MKNIAVLGLTGSIGLSVVEIVRKHPDQFNITFATSHNNYRDMQQLAEELSIDRIVMTSEKVSEKMKDYIASGSGQADVLEILTSERFDMVINAIAGSAGLVYTYHALKNNQTLALANKESLVMAGHLFREKINERQVIPIDSEHSALLQIMNGLSTCEVRKMIITASGGPFRELPLSEFDSITPAQALQHPTWSMGAKITIDSATMFNKGLEVIEAHWLFDLPYEKIDAVIHPQSVVHSLIECIDGSILAQMSNPSMQLPILYALTYPDHLDSDFQTSLIDLPPLTFTRIDPERYPLYTLVREAGQAGGIMPAVLNAANEACIELFLNNAIGFPDIYGISEKYLNKQVNITDPDLETILRINEEVYNEIISNYG